MPLRFVLGRAGSGKTDHCLGQVARALGEAAGGPPLLLLVPEQATFQVERALLERVPGFARAHVVSFNRLAWRVRQELGGAARPAIGELGRRMLLRSIVAAEAENLRIFGRVADRPGFIDRLAGTLREFADHRVQIAQLDGPLGAKLHDLALVRERYRAALEGRFTDPDGQLEWLAERLPGSRLALGARVWVDGFAGFTPAELRVIEVLARTADEVQIALLLDPDEAAEADESSLFHPTQQTRRQLLDLGVPLLEPVCLRERTRFRTAALAHIERELFDYPGERFSGEPAGVSLVAAANRRAEVDAAAAEILRLVRDEGYRYREIAVIVRDLDAYLDLVATTFRAHRIPLFVDQRRTVAHHPLVELIRSALEAVAGRWPYEAVFRYLKTDLIPLPRHQVDRLENYVLEHGIRGSRWTDRQPWRYRRRLTLEEDEPEAPRDEAFLREIDHIRREAAAALAAFGSRVARRAALPVADLTAALYRLLQDLGVAERLREWSDAAEAEGDLEGAQEHLQVWQAVVELLDQTVEGLPGEALTLAGYRTVLEAGLQGLRVGLVPPGLDQVLVGGVERSRHPALRAVLLLGANDGAFPRHVEEDVVFSDAERAQLAAAGMELGPAGRLRALHEQYLTYVALTRAGERLWISHAAADEEGRALAPAILVRRLRALLPGLAPAIAAGEVRPATVSTAGELISGVVRQLRRLREGAPVDEAWLDLYQLLGSEPELRARALPLLAALGYRGHAEAVDGRALWGDGLLASVSQLESFAACPFQHFARYGLRLRERPVWRLQATDLGRFYHAALSLLTRTLLRRGLGWAALDAQGARALVAEVAAELAPRLQDEILASSGRHRHTLRLACRTLETVALALAEHERRGRFRPVAVEAGFGPGPDAARPGLAFDLGDGGRLTLQGRIDRLDQAEAGGRRLVRVIDYKSSPRELRLDRLYHGLSLQLGIYLLAGAAGAEPAGLLYLPVHDPVVPVEGPEAPRPNVNRASGWVLDDPDAIAAMDESLSGELVPVRVRQDGRPHRDAHVVSPARLQAMFRRIEAEVVAIGRGIRGGRAAAAPYRIGQETPCAFCAFRPVCGFDPLVPGYAYRSLPKLSAGEVWERLDG